MRFLPGNAQHIGARRTQQDSFAFSDPDDRPFTQHGGFVAIVCDGMGGMEHGDAASHTAVQAFLEAYRRKGPEENIPDALARCAREANDAVVAVAQGFGLTGGIGTTLAAAVFHENELYYVSVGDSALFHIRRGTIRMVNRHHVFANLLDQAVARGMLSREEAESHPERESLTSFIGAQKLEEVDRNTSALLFQSGETLLIASDGLFKTLESGEILAALQGTPQSWPEALVARTLAKQREYQDNVTVLSVTAASESQVQMDQTVILPRPVLAELSSGMAPRSPKPVAPEPRQPALLGNGIANGTGSTQVPLSASGPPPIPGPDNSPPGVSFPPRPLRRAIEPDDPEPSPKKLWAVILLILALAAAVAGWWFVHNRAHGAEGVVHLHYSPDSRRTSA